MRTATIKRGATFQATITFEEEEWLIIYPWDSIVSYVGQGSRRYPVTITVDVPTRKLTLIVEDTSDWLTMETGMTSSAIFDVAITRDGKRLRIPSSSNIPLKIIEGVSF